MTGLELTGKVALIIGASRGLGAAVTNEVALCGAQVVLASRNKNAVDNNAEVLRSKGFQANSLSCDVTSFASIHSAITEVIRLCGKLDIVINCAGVPGPIQDIKKVDLLRWKETIETNLIGAFYVFRAVLPVLHEQKMGVIINVSSGAAEIAAEKFSAYCVAKAGLAMLSRVAHAEEYKSGIRIYSLKPGRMDTNFHKTSLSEDSDAVKALPTAKLISPTIPAKIIAYLCTPEAEDLSGMELSVNDRRFSAILAAYDQHSQENAAKSY